MAKNFEQCQGPGEENVNSGPSTTDYVGTGSRYVIVYECFLESLLKKIGKQLVCQSVAFNSGYAVLYLI